MRVKQYIQLTFKFKKEGENWTAYCEELGTATYAKKIEEAKERIREAALLHLNTLEEVGERERFFKENNIKLLNYTDKKKDLYISGPFDQNTYIMPYIHSIKRKHLSL